MTYTLRQLQVFSAVAAARSYTLAAERLHLTQPAVFAQVRQLEAQIGQPLIVRVGRRMDLTEAGELVLQSAAAMLAEVSRLESDLRALAGLGIGRLDLAVVSTAKYILPALIGPFCRDHPGIDIRLTVCNRADLLDRLRAGRDDLCVLGAVPEDMPVDHVRLADNPIVIVAPPQHPLADRTGLTLSDLAGHALVMREAGSGTRRAAEAAFEAAGVTPIVRHELGANEAVKQAVMAGLGVAVLARGAVQLELDHGYLVELPVGGFPLARFWSLAWNRDRRRTRAAEALREHLMTAAASA